MDNSINNETNVTLKLKHLIVFLSTLVIILVAVIGFFFRMLKSDIEKKTDNSLYELNKEHITEDLKDISNDLEKFGDKVDKTNKSLHNLNMEVGKLIQKANNGNNNTLVPNTTNDNTQPPNNYPSPPSF